MNKSFLSAFTAQSSLTSSLNDQNFFFTLLIIIDTFSLAFYSQSSTTFSIQQFFPSFSSSFFLNDHELFSTSSKSILNLIETLNKDSTQIQKFLLSSEIEATENELERIVENSRVIDLQLDRD